jgi:hypothetical protein
MTPTANLEPAEAALSELKRREKRGEKREEEKSREGSFIKARRFWTLNLAKVLDP